MDTITRDRVYGVDFSGAKDAGKRIWIANGLPAGGQLQIVDCKPAEDLPGSGKRREQALQALCNLIANDHGAAFGLDFPFSLPKSLLGGDSWESFVLTFPENYATPEAFREKCREMAGGRELKRATDEAAQTPFSPYNIRLFRQTYYGIRDLLHPLVKKKQACALPLQQPADDRAWLLEICPASTLKHEGLYSQYKGADFRHRSARHRILQAFDQNRIDIREPTLRARILEDEGGDALDSVIAALTVFEAINRPLPADLWDAEHTTEGYVFLTPGSPLGKM